MTAVDHAELKRLAEGAKERAAVLRRLEALSEVADALEAMANGSLSALSEIEGLKAERDAWKRRGDGHWETLRSIREFAREGDCERIIRWVSDAGSGYTEDTKNTLGKMTDRALEAERQLDALRPVLVGVDLASDAPDDLKEWARAVNLRTQAPDSWRPTRGQVINAICNSSPFGPDYKHPDLLRMSDAILALRPQTAESGN